MKNVTHQSWHAAADGPDQPRNGQPRGWDARRRRRCSTPGTRCGTRKNVFVTDGAAMVSSSCVNPSLTYMALTARAAAYAVSRLKRNEL